MVEGGAENTTKRSLPPLDLKAFEETLGELANNPDYKLLALVLKRLVDEIRRLREENFVLRGEIAMGPRKSGAKEQTAKRR